MTRLIFFCCLLFGTLSAVRAQQGFRAQGFNVSVLNDAEEPLIGAYIYVNGKAAAVTDTLGLAVIPQGKLKIGDSISVSYVFTKGQSVAVDHIMLIKGEYQFILEESHGLLQSDEVTVKAKIKRLYRKSLPIRRRTPFPYYALYSTHFTMNITNPRDSVPSHSVAGRVEGAYISPYFREMFSPVQYNNSVVGRYFNPCPSVLDSLQISQSPLGFVNDLPLEITTYDDTINLEQTIKYFLPRALQNNNLALWRVYEPEPNYKELEMYPEARVNYGYLGKDQDASTFRLTYSGHGAGTTSEVVVKSDVVDNFNREIVEVALSFKDTINGSSYYVKAKTREEHEILYVVGEKGWSGWYDFIAPYELEYYIKENDGTVVNITMRNINIRSLFFEVMKNPLNEDSFVDFHEKNDMNGVLTYIYNESERYLREMVPRKKR